jgi:MerR family transcriptional regulator, thiopeptide resistance regulator
MAGRRAYQVKEVAELAGVTIRTLHHYDAIGLLSPSARSAAGYRLYDDDDLLRLQQILIGRELGLSLEAIRRSLDDPHFDRRAALRAQRVELAARAERTQRMLSAIDAALTALNERDTTMTNVDIEKIFDGFDPEQYAEEAERRWGDTEAYRVSVQRTKSYGEADWRKIKDEQAAIFSDAAAAQRDGVRADEPRAMDIAERHRLAIDRWFYPCSHRMHRGLADLWQSDRRFADNIDKHGAGLTDYLAAAVRANASRAPA